MRAPKGMLDVLPPESARWTDVVAAFRGPGRAFRLRAVVTPIVEHYRGLRPGRRDHRRRAQGDVRLRRPRRPPPRAAPGGHCARRAGLRAAPPDDAVEGLVPRTELPGRAAAGRAATASTGNSARRCSGSTIPTSTSRSSSCSGASIRDLGLRDVRLLLNSMGDAETRHALPRGAARVLARARGAARRRDGARGGEPVAYPRLEASRLVRDARARAAARRIPHATRRPRTSSACRKVCRRSGSRSRSRPGSCAASTTTRAPSFELAERRARRRAERDRRRRSLRPARRGDGRPADAVDRFRFGNRTAPARVRCGRGVAGPGRARRRVRGRPAWRVPDTARLLAELRESGLVG